MVLSSELIANTVLLITRPFSLFKLVFMLGIKVAFNVLQTWVEILRVAISVHVNIFWNIIMWTISVVSLPWRIFTSLQRERQLALHLHEMQIDLENLLWDRKDLEEHLQKALKDCRIMESMLSGLEDDYEKAIAKIGFLEAKLQDLKNENLKLKEFQGKEFWSDKGWDDTRKGQSTKVADNYEISYGGPWKSSYNKSDIILEDLMRPRDSWEEGTKTKAELLDLFKTRSKSSALAHPFSLENIPEEAKVNIILAQQRRVALSRSLFSAVLSLLVGMIIWEAEDPCMPLVVALFIVVGMSLTSVVHYFSTIQNKPASDAVALLSFNWFILGTLTYPTLPRVARMLDPLVLRFVDHTIRFLGSSS